MKIDFYSEKTGNFSIDIPDDKNIYLLSGGKVPTKELLEKNIVNYYKQDGCKFGTRSILSVSDEESVRRIKSCIDIAGEKKALYNMYRYAETSQGSDLYIYGVRRHYDYDYLLEGKEDSQLSEQDHDGIEMG